MTARHVEEAARNVTATAARVEAGAGIPYEVNVARVALLLEMVAEALAGREAEVAYYLLKAANFRAGDNLVASSTTILCERAFVE